jgi:hypothetical protein
MRLGGKSGVWMSSQATVAAIKPSGAGGAIIGMTTICAQQQRHPSPVQSSPESWVVCVEKRQAGDDTASQAKISVAARSSKRSVITRRIVDRCAIGPMHL